MARALPGRARAGDGEPGGDIAVARERSPRVRARHPGAPAAPARGAHPSRRARLRGQRSRLDARDHGPGDPQRAPARATIETAPSDREEEGSATARERVEARKAEAVSRFVHAWETGDFAKLVSMLTEGAILTMPPWVYWLDGRDAIVATMLSPGTWEGEPRPGRYRIVPCGMNGQPAGLAYVRSGDGPYVAVCMTVMTVTSDGRVSGMDTFVLPQQFIAWGHPATLDPTEVATDEHEGHATARVNNGV